MNSKRQVKETIRRRRDSMYVCLREIFLNVNKNLAKFSHVVVGSRRTGSCCFNCMIWLCQDLKCNS